MKNPKLYFNLKTILFFKCGIEVEEELMEIMKESLILVLVLENKVFGKLFVI